MCPHWLYTGQAMTHCSAEGLSTPHPHQTYTHAGCRHDAWTCQQTQTSGRVLTQKHTYAASSLHTQTHIWGHFSLWHYSTRSDTHTHTHTPSEEARWNHSMGCWPFTLRRTWFLTVSSPFPGPLSSPPSSHLPSSLLLSLIFVSASSPRSHLLRSFYLTFLFVLPFAGLFIPQTIHDKGRSYRADCSIHREGKKTLWLQRCAGRSRVITLGFWRKKITRLSRAITRKCTFTLARSLP